MTSTSDTDAPPPAAPQRNNPLHGLTLEAIVTALQAHYGWAGLGEQIPIRCAFGDFAVKNGVMTPRALAFDTSETVITGTGTIDLRNERLDLTLKPKTRRFSPLSLRSPLYVEGSFKHPNIRPDYKRMGLRAAAAAALGAITAPAAALVATTDLGNAKGRQYCGGK